MQKKKNGDDLFLTALSFGIAVACNVNKDRSVVQTLAIGFSVACIIHTLVRFMPLADSYEVVELPKASIIQSKPKYAVMATSILGLLVGILIGVICI